MHCFSTLSSNVVILVRYWSIIKHYRFWVRFGWIYGRLSFAMAYQPCLKLCNFRLTLQLFYKSPILFNFGYFYVILNSKVSLKQFKKLAILAEFCNIFKTHQFWFTFACCYWTLNFGVIYWCFCNVWFKYDFAAFSKITSFVLIWRYLWNFDFWGHSESSCVVKC